MTITIGFYEGVVFLNYGHFCPVGLNENNFHNTAKCNGNDTSGIFISRIDKPYLDNSFILL